tara:strand:+ start:969 stop:2174 length:1206 start_codon:yes stop_codon:yes gene_type:complete
MIKKNFRNKLFAFFRINKSLTYLIYVKIKVENYKLKYLLHLMRKDKNRFKAFIRRMLYIRDFIIIFFCNYYLFLKNRNNNNYFKEIVFVINNNDGWVLEGIANDLAKCLVSNYKDLKVDVISFKVFKKKVSKTTKYIFMHQVMTRKIFKMNINLENTYCYYTHTRDLNNSDLFNYAFLKGIFFQCKKELNLLKVNGLKQNNLIYLPVGYDKFVFPKAANLIKRKYDFCFSTPFYDEAENPHYFIRKEIKLVEFISAKLSLNGFNVVIVGKNWPNSSIVKESNCVLKEDNYLKKSETLQDVKCFINLSSYEGGPVTLLEAAASGCNIISRDVGIAFDLSQDISNFKLLKDCDTYSKYYQEVLNSNNQMDALTKKNYINNLKLLENKYEFNILAEKIYNNIFN